MNLENLPVFADASVPLLQAKFREMAALLPAGSSRRSWTASGAPTSRRTRAS